MNLANMNLADLSGMLVGLFLTLSVFSYLLGDNVFFRIAIHIFIGVVAAYTLAIAFYNVVWPQLIIPIITGSQADRLFILVPLLLGALLLTKAAPRLTGWGAASLAYLVGVAVATAIGGAVLGTVFPQIGAAINVFDRRNMPDSGVDFLLAVVDGLIILVGTITTLVYFQFSARTRNNQRPKRPGWVDGAALIGQIFIAISFGTIFAGTYAAALTAFIERWHFLITVFQSLIGS
jgi:hypothetical protein